MYTGTEHVSVADQVVVEHGVVPVDDLFVELSGMSANGGRLDLDNLLAGRPQPCGGEGLHVYRVGDAVAGRDIHAAIYDARRLCQVL